MEIEESFEVFEKVSSNWDRSETNNGVPYYLNHRTETTAWDHPYFVKIIEELGEHDGIRYAAYRTSVKLRRLQKSLQFDCVTLSLVGRTFDDHGLTLKRGRVISYPQLQAVLMDIYLATDLPVPHLSEIVLAELMGNLILCLCDINRNGKLHLLDVKLILGTLSCALLVEKYKFYYQELKDDSTYISKSQMAVFLKALLKLPDLIHESSSFGGIGPALSSCFEMAAETTGLSEDAFLAWLRKEPQTLVWLPTLHRVAAAESVKHESKCNICKAFPIVGFRYRCLKCFGFDLCQQCFFSARVGKKHKLKHPIQEYCLPTTSKEDQKAFFKTVKNNIGRNSKRKPKTCYLPIEGSTSAPVQEWELESSMVVSETHSSLDGRPHQTSATESMQDCAGPVNSPALTETSVELSPKRVTSQLEPVDRHDGHQPTDKCMLEENMKLENIIETLKQENIKLHSKLARFDERPEAEKVEVSSQKNLPKDPIINNNTMASVEIHRSDANHVTGEPCPPPRITYPLSQTMNDNCTPISAGLDKHKVSFVTNGPTPPVRSASIPMTPYSALKQSSAVEFCTPIHPYSPIARTPGNYSTWDETNNTLGLSVSQAQCYPEEEHELDRLIQKLNNGFPTNASYSVCSDSRAYNSSGMEEALRAVNNIGDKMTHFVDQATQPYSHC